MLGMRYLHLLAEKLGLPLIFCLALGSNLGGHSGSLPLSIIAQQYTLLSNRIPVIGSEMKQIRDITFTARS